MPTKIHKNLVNAIGLCLQDIFQKGFYADKVIEYHFKRQRKWGARDRRFVAEAVYEMVRHWRYLWYLNAKEPCTELESLEKLFYIWWFWAKQESHLGEIDRAAVEQRIEANKALALQESYPDWLFQLAEKELGDEWPSICQALNQTNQLYLRCNTLKIDRQSLLRKLHEEGFADALTVADNEEGIVIPSKKNVFRSKAFQSGFFEVQDMASQMVAPQLRVQAGMRVIDACAGAGGKSLHLAALMQNKGKILALDVHTNKLEQLRKRAKRAGIDIIETRLIEGTKTIKRLVNSADALLLDVPCSGLGVLRRNPDSKWKLKPERLLELQDLQKKLLRDYSQMLKVGGRMVYATCSILPSENQRQVQDFLSQHKNFELLAEKTLRPDIEGYDGFYFASLRRLT